MTSPRISGQHVARRTELLTAIAELAESQLSPRDFLHEFIERVTVAAGGWAGAVWLCDAQDRLQVACQFKVQGADVSNGAELWSRHANLVQNVLASGRGLVFVHRPENSTGDEIPADANLIIVARLDLNGQTRAVAEVIKRRGPDPAADEEAAGLVMEACAAARQLFEPNASHAPQERHELWGRLDAFLREVHRSLDLRTTAFAIANEGRRFIQCDRVSVVLVRGRQCHIEAISGQDYIERRSNTVRLMRRLASVVARTREALFYPEKSADLPPQVERPLQAYLDQSHSRFVVVLPLMRNSQERRPRPGQRALAVIVIEQMQNPDPPVAFHERLELLREHSTFALSHALDHHGILFLALWRFLGGFRTRMTTGRFAKIFLAVALLVGGVGALALVPHDFEIEARGTLQPTSRREVFARVEGVVDAVHVRHMDLVAAGAPLVTLRSPELDAKILEIRGQIQAKQKELNALESVRIGERSTTTRAEEKQLLGRKQEIEAMLTSLQDQLVLYLKKRTDLVVRSPLEGSVVTLDVHERLTARPVQPGDALVSVADTNSEWELEVLVPEDQMGYVLGARQQLLAEQASEGEDLRVRFILATEPTVTFEGVLKEIHQRAEVRGDDGNTVLVKVAIDKNGLPDLRPGASVIARVHCGQRSIGFVWFRDLFDFVQTRILFRL